VIKARKMGGTRSIHAEKLINNSVRKSEGRKDFEDLGLDVRIIFRSVWRKEVAVVWIGLIRLRIVISRKFLWKQDSNFCFRVRPPENFSVS
jgi:hypothetical protein